MRNRRTFKTREMKLQEKQEAKELAEAKKSLRNYLNRELSNEKVREYNRKVLKLI
jgi:hypothetical protein